MSYRTLCSPGRPPITACPSRRRWLGQRRGLLEIADGCLSDPANTSATPGMTPSSDERSYRPGAADPVLGPGPTRGSVYGTSFSPEPAADESFVRRHRSVESQGAPAARYQGAHLPASVESRTPDMVS